MMLEEIIENTKFLINQTFIFDIFISHLDNKLSMSDSNTHLSLLRHKYLFFLPEICCLPWIIVILLVQPSTQSVIHIFQSCSESNALYFILLQNIESGCLWFGIRDLIFPPRFFFFKPGKMSSDMCIQIRCIIEYHHAPIDIDTCLQKPYS